MPVALSRTPCKYLRWRALQRFANVVMFSILGVFGGPYSASGRALRELESLDSFSLLILKMMFLSNVFQNFSEHVKIRKLQFWKW